MMEAKENSGALAGATGVQNLIQGFNFCGEYIAPFPILAMHLWVWA